MSIYGRNRQSIADIEDQLNDLFHKHPKSQLNEAGDPVIPGDALVDVFRAFSDLRDGVELMTNDEMDMLKTLLASNPGLEVTPQILLQFIAARSKPSPQESPENSAYESDASERGRTRDWEVVDSSGRSSSSDSAGPHNHRSRPPSRGPPHTPLSASVGSSPFDASKRQRSTPLASNAPSSWSRRPPAHRRKSDASQYATSDSEFNGPPTSFRGVRTPNRARAPSNPASPKSMSQPDLNTFSPTSPPSRPHSRARSQPQSHFSNMNASFYGSPASPVFRGSQASPSELDFTDDNFNNTISSLPMPRSCDSDSDSGGEDHTLGLVPDRASVSSTASMEPLERMEAIQRTNAELTKRLMETERTVQRQQVDHEQELEEMQSRLEELRSELSATKREEKELRAKERTNSTQISALESEIAKLQKSLDNARMSYQSLQKQYQEQCAESERYRNTLRLRDQEIKDHKDFAALQQIEAQKWVHERETYEERIAHLEVELAIAQQALIQLDEQKQETLMLKETIDRMRFDMDEMRSNANAAAYDKGGSSGNTSVTGSVSKSLGAELADKLKGTQWTLEDEEEGVAVVSPGSTASVSGTVESETVEQQDGDETEGEDVVQTIITRKKRKVASRANRIETRTFEEVKEYSDAYTQHDLCEFTSSWAVQTDPQPQVVAASLSIQKETAITKVTTDCQTQTDVVEEGEPSRSSSPEEATASSSSTLLPPTPKVAPGHLDPDLPPAYEQDQDDWRQVADVLKKWHKGADIPLQGIPDGVSDDALEGWKALQDEVGVGCVVMDKILEKSVKTGPRSRDRRRSSVSGTKGRFYNIYNTYVYGKDGSSAFTPAVHALMCAGASAMMVLLMTPYVMPHYNVPGGATYYDRHAWASFNSMQAMGEGFAADGTNSVWSFLGTIGGGAVRIVRGWPT